MTDPIADMLTRIRNAQLVNKREVRVPFSTVKFEIAKNLKSTKFVSGVKKVKGEKFPEILITLKKDGIRGIERVSTPGQRLYSRANELPTNFKYGQGVVIVSTSKGILDARIARKEGIGGELICRVW